MSCGVCGGGTRLFTDTRYGRPITDWKHTDVPPGTQPHRPVLGTPIPKEALDRIFRPDVVEEESAAEEGPRLPLVPPRAATEEEVASSQSATGILRLLELHRWVLVEPVAYYQAADSVEHMILKARRRDLGAVVTWRRRPGKGKWELEGSFRLGEGHTNQVGSEQLKNWIGQRDERCPDCGRSSIVHDERGNCP